MRLEMHGDIISSLGGRIIVAIVIAERADAAKIAIARRATSERMAKRDDGTAAHTDVTEARERGLVL